MVGRSNEEPPPPAAPSPSQGDAARRAPGVAEILRRLECRLECIETTLAGLAQERAEREYYSTAEVAQKLGKSEFTVREWCRLGRIRARKWRSGRGAHTSWVIAHEELLRIRRE